MPVLTIFEPRCSGHRMQYVRWISREAIARGHEVRVATFEESLDHPNYLALERECGDRVRAEILPMHEKLRKEPPPGQANASYRIKRELRFHNLFSSSYRRLDERPDVVLLPYLDYCAQAVALLGSPFGHTPWAAISMRASFHHGLTGVEGPPFRLRRLKGALFYRLLRDARLQALFAIDELLVHHARQEKPALAKRLRFLPDPAEAPEATLPRGHARRRLGIPDDAVVLLVYGTLTRRKGIGALLAAAAGFPEDVHLLLAGRQYPDVEALLGSSRAAALREAGRLHELDGFLGDEDQSAAFRAADIGWLGYQGHHGMSGVLVQAAAAGLPVVACSEGLVGWLTREHGLGLAVPTDDAKEVAAAVTTLARDRELSSRFAENGRRFAAPHTPRNFAGTIADGLGL